VSAEELDEYGDPVPFVLGENVGYLARERGMLVPLPNVSALEPAPPDPNAWVRVDLNDPRYAIRPEPPDLHPLIYSGMRHVISGPPEATKTLLAYSILLHLIKAGHAVAIVDFEMGSNAARILLDELGATPFEIDRIWFYSDVSGPPSQSVLEELLKHEVRLVLIDASAGAYDASGLDDNARKDVEMWAKRWIRPLWQAEVATLVIDHVTKNVEGRGKFSIGSERKIGSADVHLGCEPVNPLKRGGKAMVKVRVHKDRRGFLERPHATLVELQSDPVTHQITISLKEPDHPDAQGVFLPTALMEKVSRYLEAQTEPLSRTHVETNVMGKAEFVRKALDALVAQDCVEESLGPRGARLVRFLKPYQAVTPPQQTDEAEIERLLQKHDQELGA